MFQFFKSPEEREYLKYKRKYLGRYSLQVTANGRFRVLCRASDRSPVYEYSGDLPDTLEECKAKFVNICKDYESSLYYPV